MKAVAIITVTIITLLSLALAAKYVANGVATCWVAEDLAAELTETRPLAEAGDVEAQYSMGFMYDNGRGVCEDKNEADKWYRLVYISYTAAAKQGSADAQYSLSHLYLSGRGVSSDRKEAARWLKKAAAQEHPSAINNLAFTYNVGWGVPQDKIKAHMWYLIAFANGYHERDNTDVVDSMTGTELSKAQSMANECMQSNYKKCWYEDAEQPPLSGIHLPPYLQGHFD
jgi:hypothetical protein